MTLLVAKATIAILITFAVCALARRARASLRHAVYAALFVFLLLLPISPRVVPAMSVTVPRNVIPGVVERSGAVIGSRPTAAASLDAARDDSSPISLLNVYFTGVALMLGYLAIGVIRLRRWVAAGEVWLDGTRLATEVACADGIRRAVLVVISDEVSVPMTFGFRRQTIVFPSEAREWDDESLRRALRHELEHVRRDDWAMQLVARVACAIWWPHPLVRMALRRFCAEAERSCDDAVVEAFEPATYAQQLVTLARTLTRRPRVPALAMASPTRLGERVHAILDPSQRRGPHGRVAGMTTIVVMIAVLALFGSVRIVSAAIKLDDDGLKDAVEGGIAGALADDETYREAVVKAAEHGDVGRLEQLLERVDINHAYIGDGTMLLITAKYGHVDAVKYLLDRGADPNAPSRGDGNPLIAAAQHGEQDVVALLLDRGARIDEVVPGDENALIGACEAGYPGIVRLLIARGADVNKRVWADDREWRSPMIMARRGGHDEVVRILLAAGATK